ncbi:uncharacterized protein LOC111893297 [Lactuca sativa]|uniref:uncharacterized protein LOC111893297 n=1 Tax=Lactuca sativa TaxID=4236 RepID=UPI000CBCA230|nr:uncharacterized protein LOC111893297 [Lactuca sativa]
MVSASRSAGSTSGVNKSNNGPSRTCYRGVIAHLKISTSEKNPGRRYFGCRYWPDEVEYCGYFEWYDGEVSLWYKEFMFEVMAKKKKTIGQEKGNPHHGEISLMNLVRVGIGLLVILVVMVGILMWMVYKG